MQNFSQKSPSHEILLFFASQTEASCELHAQQQVCGCAIINMPYFIRGRNENIVRMEREGGSGQVLQPLQQCPNIKQENKHLDSCRTVYAQCYLLKADRSFEAVWIGIGSKDKMRNGWFHCYFLNGKTCVCPVVQCCIKIHPHNDCLSHKHCVCGPDRKDDWFQYEGKEKERISLAETEHRNIT